MAYIFREVKCPKCSIDMIVLEHILEGIDTKDDKIERLGIRGI